VRDAILISIIPAGLPRAITQARTNGELLGVDVRTSSGSVVFSSADKTRWAEHSSGTLSEQLGGLVVSAAVLESAAGPGRRAEQRRWIRRGRWKLVGH